MRMHKVCLFFIFSFLLIFLSCETTREYVKTTKQLYENDELVHEEYTVFENGAAVEHVAKSYHDFSDKHAVTYSDGTKNLIYSISEKSEKKPGLGYDEVEFSLVESYLNEKSKQTKTTVLGTKKMRMVNGKFVYFKNDSGKTVRSTGDLFPADFEKAFDEITAYIEEHYNDFDDADNKIVASSENRVESEKITVRSVPNKPYILYQFAGKPFVIAGATAWNLLKCAGYACINFIGGYNAATGNVDGLIWMIPSWSASKEKAAEAREANKVTVYPEYHIPFTNNHITVEKYNQDISAVSLADEDAEIITPVEVHEFDTSMSVERSAAADAASTAALAGLIGTAVTIPVSGLSWVGGAAVGVYGEVMANK